MKPGEQNEYPYDCARCGHDRRRPHDHFTYWKGRQNPLAWLRVTLDIYDEYDNDLGGEFEFVGAYGSTLDGIEWKAKLCESCCIELREWINAGIGEGVQERALW